MRELGEESGPAHRGWGEQAARAGLDRLFLVGEEMEAAFRAAPAGGGAAAAGAVPAVEWFTDLDLLAARLRGELRAGDLVVLKGSRGAELERLIPAIQRAVSDRARCDRANL